MIYFGIVFEHYHILLFIFKTYIIILNLPMTVPKLAAGQVVNCNGLYQQLSAASSFILFTMQSMIFQSVAQRK